MMLNTKSQLVRNHMLTIIYFEKLQFTIRHKQSPVCPDGKKGDRFIFQHISLKK